MKAESEPSIFSMILFWYHYSCLICWWYCCHWRWPRYYL